MRANTAWAIAPKSVSGARGSRRSGTSARVSVIHIDGSALVVLGRRTQPATPLVGCVDRSREHRTRGAGVSSSVGMITGSRVRDRLLAGTTMVRPAREGVRTERPHGRPAAPRREGARPPHRVFLNGFGSKHLFTRSRRGAQGACGRRISGRHRPCTARRRPEESGLETARRRHWRRPIP